MSGVQLIKIGLISLVGVGLVLVYWAFDPMQSVWFPKCPSLLLTGCECAGCGSQRVIHHLLNFEIMAALKCNPLVVLLVAYLIVLVPLEFTPLKKRYDKLYNFLTGRLVITLLIIIIIIYSIVRNL